MSLFISNAYANTPAAAPAGGGWDLLIMLVAFGLIFYFLISPSTSQMCQRA